MKTLFEEGWICINVCSENYVLDNFVLWVEEAYSNFLLWVKKLIRPLILGAFWSIA